MSGTGVRAARRRLQAPAVCFHGMRVGRRTGVQALACSPARCPPLTVISHVWLFQRRAPTPQVFLFPSRATPFASLLFPPLRPT